MLIWKHAFALFLGAFNVLYAARKKAPLAKKKVHH